jgi:hypothetical protein
VRVVEAVGVARIELIDGDSACAAGKQLPNRSVGDREHRRSPWRHDVGGFVRMIVPTLLIKRVENIFRAQTPDG